MHQLETDRTQVPPGRDQLVVNYNNKQNNLYASSNGGAGGSAIKPNNSSDNSNIMITPETAYESSNELWGCTPLQVVSVIKFLAILVAFGAIIGIILSSLGAAHGGSEWMGEQPGETFILFIMNIVWSSLILILTSLIIYNLFKREFSLGIKLEIDMCLVLTFLACSLAGGILVSIIDQTSSISYSCSQVYSKIWPDTLLSASQTASDNLCTTSCPCNFTSASQASYAMAGVFAPAGPVSAVGCSSYQPLSTEVLSKLKAMETTWKCAGICEVSNKYLFSDVNRGQPNQSASCFAIASQKLYPLRNYFLVGDFSISLVQALALTVLLLMKKFLAREDVRFAHNSIPLQQEKQQLFRSNIYANANNGYNNPDNDRSILQEKRDQPQLYPKNNAIANPNNNSANPGVIVVPAANQPNNNQNYEFNQNPRPLAPFIEEKKPVQIYHQPEPYMVSKQPQVSSPPPPPLERIKEPEPIIEYSTPQPYQQPIKNTQVVQEPAKPQLLHQNYQPAGLETKQMHEPTSNNPQNRINNQFSDIDNQQNRDQNSKISKSPMVLSQKPFEDDQSHQRGEIPIIDSGVPSKQQKGHPHQQINDPLKNGILQSQQTRHGLAQSLSPPLIDSGVPSQSKKPQSHLLSNPNAYSNLANNGNAILTTPRTAQQQAPSQPSSHRSFLDGLQLDNPNQSRLPSTKSENSNANSHAGKKFFKQNNNASDKFDV